MSVKICSVTPKSIAAKKHLKPLDILISINKNDINDVLDYDFYASEEVLELVVQKPNGKLKNITLKKEQYEDLGLNFETYLMDGQRACKNKCVFCFIDQLPPGMRDTLYFKDDDDRLSFIFGNYITLTNIPSEEIDRIIKMHISPINISVHTTNPELRVKMMNNRFAGERLSFLYRLANAGIKLNCQLVLCPGYNDGEELKRSLSDLLALGESIISIACVPVGTTKFRENLPELRGFTQAEAKETIEIIESFSEKALEAHGARIVYPADEFFIKAKLPIPPASYYDEFPQIENGVGIIASQRAEFIDAISIAEYDDAPRNITIATGVDAAPHIQYLVDETRKKWHNLNVQVIAVKNIFFGETITVAGLLTGQDLLSRLKDEKLGDELLLPSCMLRSEQDIFLDDMSLEALKRELNINIRPCENDGYLLLDAILGINDNDNISRTSYEDSRNA